MGENRRMMPTWFFVGAMVVVYFFLIFAACLYEFFHAPSIVLAIVHPAIWWGAATPVSGSFMGAPGLAGSRPSPS